MIITRVIPLLLVSTAALFGQSDTWALLRGIYPGQTVHVHLLDGKLQKGGFISTTDSTIVVRQRAGDQTFAKDQIRKVSVRKASKRWRNAAIGAAIGAISVGALAAAVGDGEGGGAGFVAAAAAGYAIIGAGIGALFPGYDTLFRRPGK